MSLRIPPSLCLVCRGRKRLCGLAYCPALVRVKVEPLRSIGREVNGSSPPSLFVGRVGYPKVLVGPLVPPISGETKLYDTPELWTGLGIDDILEFRYSLVRGIERVGVEDAASSRGIVEKLQELAMAVEPVDSEMRLSSRPRGFSLSEHEPPFGPSARLDEVRMGNAKLDSALEKAYYDTDWRASDAVFELYRRGLRVSSIQRALSAGCMGEGRRRRLVPTRWSITAVDDMISKRLVDQVKGFPELDEFLVYVRHIHKNMFVALLMPDVWSFEWMEAWFPNTTWNLRVKGGAEVMGDYEYWKGRSTYPDIGGCYFASRLTVAEALIGMRRQARCIILREIYPGFTIPIGVWFVRENLREMFKSKPSSFSSYEEALKYAFSKLKVPASRWMAKSALLKREVKLTGFL